MVRPKKKITDDENQKPLFLNSLAVTEAPESFNLPGIKILKKNRSPEKIILEFYITGISGLLNIFLIVNGQKKDMLYQVYPGTHSFSFIPTERENLIELYYSRGMIRSGKTNIIL